MYGPLDQDPVVRYYDVAFLKGSEYDQAWYAQKAATYGGSVLDLACGAGRIQEGFENAPKTFLRLFEGKNFGKQLLKIAELPPGSSNSG